MNKFKINDYFLFHILIAQVWIECMSRYIKVSLGHITTYLISCYAVKCGFKSILEIAIIDTCMVVLEKRIDLMKISLSRSKVT